MNEDVAASFERSFLSAPLSKQISGCESYKLAPLFVELFGGCERVLDAGCGSGRWCGWLDSHGIAADGIDWSEALCERAARDIPGSRFFARDMENSGLPDGSYGGVLALGSIEHAARGPKKALAEFYRLLRPNGVAVITVPNGSRLRTVWRGWTGRFEAVKGLRFVRKIAGKPPLGANARTWREARRVTVPEWHPRLALGPKGWSFYEYEFNSRQMDGFLAAAGFVVKQRFTAFVEEGVFHTFGRLAGQWNAERARVDLKLPGRLLTRLLPASMLGHMLCYVVEKPSLGQ